MVDLAVFFVCVARDIIVLFIHVDDSTITGSSVTLINVFKRRIAKRFSITDLGSISWLLGLAIIRDRAKRMLMISQESYVESLLEYTRQILSLGEQPSCYKCLI